MDFGFSEEQDLLRAEVRKFLDESCPLDEVRKITEGDTGWSPELWARVSELGWTGILVPEEHGGVGLGWVDLVVILEETGRTLFPSPLVSTCLVQDALVTAGSDAQRERWLPELAAGRVIGTVACLEESDVVGPDGVALVGAPDGDGFVLTGAKHFVHDVDAAGVFLVAFRKGAPDGDIGLALVSADADGLSIDVHAGIDLTRRQGTLRLDAVRVGADAVLPGDGAATLQRVLDAGATAVVSEAIGAAEAAIALTTSYARQRIQFGRPIGQFQAVKHPLAEMYVDVESFKSLAYYAAWCLDEGHADTSLAASRAKAYASDAFARIGVDTVQLHGGIGYTWEYDAHLFLKRAKWTRPAFGDADHHFERTASLGGL